MARTTLVDDAASMRVMTKEALTQSGYSDFVEAQDKVETMKKYGEEEPDMVTMDITTPNVDGLQVLKRIKESDASAKIVMYTAMGQGGMVVDAIKSGVEDFITKSFNAERIVQAANPILGK